VSNRNSSGKRPGGVVVDTIERLGWKATVFWKLMKAALTLKCNNMTVAVAMTLCVREEVVVMVVVVLEVVCKLTSTKN
jgi:hypothetical protein